MFRHADRYVNIIACVGIAVDDRQQHRHRLLAGIVEAAEDLRRAGEGVPATQGEVLLFAGLADVEDDFAVEHDESLERRVVRMQARTLSGRQH